MPTPALIRLRGSDATRWGNITRAQALSRDKAIELSSLVGDLLPTDEGTLVVFGSLARGEYTIGSDLDWAILIDGRADSRHLEIVRELKPRLKEAKFSVPGPTEVFGGLVFSHDLVHAIGGDEDTNKNMTRRLLLLLESRAIDTRSSKLVHERILRAVLSRYVEEDANFIVGNHGSDRIPRFLLNDVVRFWRTMAVDYANKYRVRAGEKWALRNIKLRMSRKLIFVSGLLMCISWALRNMDGEDEEFLAQKLVSHLQDWTQCSPLESLAIIIERYAPQLAPAVFDSYDAFVAVLNDEKKRRLLEQLSPEGAYSDSTFLDARSIAISFDSALRELLFESEEIAPLVKKYGVF
jgi:predicted nucleotidyltransferase